MTFTDRIMNDAADDIHQLEEDNAYLLKKIDILIKDNNRCSSIAFQLISCIVTEIEYTLFDFSNVGDKYVLSIPMSIYFEDPILIAKSVIEYGIKVGSFCDGRYTYRLPRTRGDSELFGPNCVYIMIHEIFN